MKYEFAPELVSVLEMYNSQSGPPEGTELKDAFRAALKGMAQQVGVTSTDEVNVGNKYFANSDDLEIQLRVFIPKKINGPFPCLYWMHGGSTMSGLPEQ